VRRTPRDIRREKDLWQAVVLLSVGETQDPVSKTIQVEGEMEWKGLRRAYEKDPTSGFKGRRFTIPAGVTVLMVSLSSVDVDIESDKLGAHRRTH
jgi:hypothetical protein